MWESSSSVNQGSGLTAGYVGGGLSNLLPKAGYFDESRSGTNWTVAGTTGANPHQGTLAKLSFLSYTPGF